MTSYNNLRVFGRWSRHSGRTLAVERPLFWSLWNHKKITSPGITDFIVSLLSSVKSVRFPWLFTLKKMPANNKKILSLACFNKVLIGSFLIREPYDGDGNGNSTKAIGLITKTTILHVHHASLYISLPSLHDYDVKMPNFTLYRGSTQATTKFPLSFYTWLWYLGIQL